MNTRRAVGTRNDRRHHGPAESEPAEEVVLLLLRTEVDEVVASPAEDQFEEDHLQREGVTFPVVLGMLAIGEHLHI